MRLSSSLTPTLSCWHITSIFWFLLSSWLYRRPSSIFSRNYVKKIIKTSTKNNNKRKTWCLKNSQFMAKSMKASNLFLYFLFLSPFRRYSFNLELIKRGSKIHTNKAMKRRKLKRNLIKFWISSSDLRTYRRRRVKNNKTHMRRNR